jgi:Mg/Co/Ni transporter MgtE
MTMFTNINPSSKAIVSQVKQGKIARILTENATANFEKLILVLNNTITLVEECRSKSTDEHLKKPIVKSISKADAIAICEKYRAEQIIDFVDESYVEDYVDSIVEMKEGVYEY